MPNTHSHIRPMFRALTGSVFVSGIALVIGSATQFAAQVTGYGSTVLSSRNALPRIPTLASLHGAPDILPEAPLDYRASLLLGMLLILLGCTLHALWVVHTTPMRRQRKSPTRRRALSL